MFSKLSKPFRKRIRLYVHAWVCACVEWEEKTARKIWKEVKKVK